MEALILYGGGQKRTVFFAIADSIESEKTSLTK